MHINTNSIMQHSTRRLRATFFDGERQIIEAELELEPGQTKTLGNTKSSADIRLGADVVSRNHLVIALDGSGEVVICDVGSSNGTFDGEVELKTNEWHRVNEGSRIYLGGEVRMVIETLAGNTNPAGSTNGRGTSTARLADLLKSQDQVVIGRGRECDLALDDPMISRHHATIYKSRDGSLMIKDMGSANGTFVNGRRIQQPMKLAPDTPIFMGRHVLRLTAAPVDLSKQTAVHTRGATLDYRGGKRGLHPTDIEIRTGSMTAIMGPSGCGKSTLLKVLNGDVPLTQGTVEIFGVDLIAGYEYLRTVIGYVPQDDIVHQELTVYEAIYYAAWLRLEHLDSAAINAKVKEVLKDLRISHIQRHLISQISGGQRKRVCIAVELLSSPLILFLDEPTSPLDPQAVEEFLSILEDLTKQGTTIVMVTHKPEDLEFMEKVIFMGEGGHVVYSGATNGYLNWFGVERATEVYARLVGAELNTWIAKYVHSKGQRLPSEPHAGMKLQSTKAAAWRQFYWLSRRYVAIRTNDRVNTLMMLGQAPLIATLICLIFADITPAVPFLVVISAIWLGTNNASRAIVGEQAIFKRERMFNLHLNTYLGSKVFVLGIFAVIQAGLLMAVITLGYQLRGAEPHWTSSGGGFIWLSMVCIASTIMGLFVSSSLNNLEKVMTLVPLVLIPQIMLAGSITRISSWLVEFLSYFTVSRWGTEGMNILQKSIHIDGAVSGEGSATQALQANLGYYYHDVFGSLAGGLLLDVCWLGVLCALFTALTLRNLSARTAAQ
jgi:ABC transport system ATP-binding/permease protein